MKLTGRRVITVSGVVAVCCLAGAAVLAFAALVRPITQPPTWGLLWAFLLALVGLAAWGEVGDGTE
jgi:tryptophan-rich sensory protein